MKGGFKVIIFFFLYMFYYRFIIIHKFVLEVWNIFVNQNIEIATFWSLLLTAVLGNKLDFFSQVNESMEKYNEIYIICNKVV